MDEKELDTNINNSNEDINKDNEQKEEITPSEVVESKEEIAEETKHNPTSLSRRGFSFISDVIFTLLVTFLFYFLSSKFIFDPISKNGKAFDMNRYDEINDILEVEQENNPLFALNPNYDETDNPKVSKYLLINDDSLKEEYSSYKEYQTAIYKYYTIYLNSTSNHGGASFISEDTLMDNASKNLYTTYWFNVFILGLDDVDNVYSDELVNSRRDFIKNNDLFMYADSYNEIGVPNESLYNENHELTSEAKTKLLSYFSSGKTSTNVTYEISTYKNKTETIKLNVSDDIFTCAFANWIYESGDVNSPFIYNIMLEYQALLKTYTNLVINTPFMVSFAFSALIFFFIIPSILKQGRTLGKLIFKLKVIKINKEEINILNLLLRSIPSILIFVLIYYVSSLMNTSFFIFISVFAILISYLVATFSKYRASIHDLIARTYVVDNIKIKEKKIEVK